MSPAAVNPRIHGSTFPARKPGFETSDPAVAGGHADNASDAHTPTTRTDGDAPNASDQIALAFGS